MKREFLGDALDHFKGGVLRLLGPLKSQVAVVPMVSDSDPWNPKERALYAALIGIEKRQIHWEPGGLTQQPAKASRDEWLLALGKLRAPLAFFDPDTGVGLRQESSRQHLFVDDLLRLTRRNSDPVLVVYQPSGIRVTKANKRLVPSHLFPYVWHYLSALQKHNLRAFAYQSAAASFLFVCSRAEPLAPVRKQMEKSLGAEKVIRRVLVDLTGSRA